MAFFEKVENLWTNPAQVNLMECFIYYIAVMNDKNEKFEYVGKARNSSRLNEYRNNMLKIKCGKERGKTQGYRAVHFALYSALENNWSIEFHPLENCTKENLNEVENKKINELKPNLNGGKTWRFSNMVDLTLAKLIR